MGLMLEEPIPMSDLTAGRVLLKCDGRDAGFVTSSAVSEHLGPIALGYIRKDFQEEGRALEILVPSLQNAKVSSLPFA
jgi:glycine cleavage system aminomethyltransferase T